MWSEAEFFYIPCYALLNLDKMTELELYKFIEESGSMTRYDGEVALIWVYHFQVEEFAKLIGEYWLDEGGVEIRLQEDYVAVDMTEILKEEGINPYAVFEAD